SARARPWPWTTSTCGGWATAPSTRSGSTPATSTPGTTSGRNLGRVTAAELLAAAVDDLVRAAGARRDATTGTRITFSPKVFIPLTQLCRDRCGYCTFAQPPARLQAPFLTADEVLAIARAGRAAGCH